MAYRRLELTNSFIYGANIAACNGTSGNTWVDSSNIASFNGCTVINGSIQITQTTFDGLLWLQYYHFLAAERSESGSMNILRVFLLLLFKDYGSAEFSGF